MLSSESGGGGGLGGRPELSVDTKGSLSTSGQASAGSTPCDWLLGNVSASGLSEGSRAEETNYFSEQLKDLPTPNGAITGPQNRALPHGFLCGSCARSLPARRQLPPTRQHHLHGLPRSLSSQSSFRPTRPRAASPEVLLSLVPLSVHLPLSPERPHGEHRTRPGVQRCPLPCSPACASSSLCALVPGGHTDQSKRRSNF